MKLPDSDKIAGIIDSKGIYKLSRWPATVSGQIKLLNAVAQKYGSRSRLFFCTPDDGYPGYFHVISENEIDEEARKRQTVAEAKATGFAKLTAEERTALGVRQQPIATTGDDLDIGFPGTATCNLS